MWCIRYMQKQVKHISIDYDGSLSSKSSCLLIFLLCVGECSPFTRIIELGQVNETIMLCCLNLILQKHIPRSLGIFCLEWWKLLVWQGVHMFCILFLEVKVVMHKWHSIVNFSNLKRSLTRILHISSFWLEKLSMY